MRKNEYSSLNEFMSQYCGIWAPSEEKWFGLDFSWNGRQYRLHTGLMYDNEASTLPDGRTILFGLYEKTNESDSEYHLIKQFASMDELLASRCIEDRLFSDVIMDDDTELLGQD